MTDKVFEGIIISSENISDCKDWAMPVVGETTKSIPVRLHNQKTHDDIVERFKKIGYDEGYQAGYKLGEAEVRDLQHKLTNITTTLTQPISLIEEEIEAQILDLVLGLTKQVLKRELVTEPSLILQIIDEAKKSLPIQASEFILHLTSEDLSAIHDLGAEEYLKSESLKITEDETLSRGEIRIESNDGEIEGTLEDRLVKIIEKVEHERHTR